MFVQDELSLCFTDVALLLPVAVLVALVAVPVTLYRIRKRGAPVLPQWTSLQTAPRSMKARVLLLALSLLLALLRAVVVWAGGHESGAADSIASLAFALASALSALVAVAAYRTSMHLPWLMRSAWVALFVVVAMRLQVAVDTRARPAERALWTAGNEAAFALFVLLFIVHTGLAVSALFFNKTSADDAYGVLHDVGDADADAGKDAASPHEAALLAQCSGDAAKSSPYDSAGWVSRILFSWLDLTLKVGYARALEPRHLLPLPTADRAPIAAEHFNKVWRAEVADGVREPKLWRAIWRAYGTQFLLGGIPKLVQDLLLFAGPVVLRQIMIFMNHPETPTSVGVGLAFAMFITSVVQSLSLHWYFFHMYRVAMRMRAALVMVIYEKSFTLSNAARQTATVGEIVNHQSDDVKKLYDLIPYLHLIWSSPLQIGIALFMLGDLLSWAALGGVAVLIVLVPVNTFIAKKSAALQKNTMKFKDSRIKAMNELLSGIRLLKLFAWEQPFADKISGIREQELGSLRRYMLLGTVTSFFWSSTPLVVSIVTFSLYALISDSFSAETAFTALALFNIIRFPMQALPSVISSTIEAYVSLGRIQGFLLKPDLDPNAVTVAAAGAAAQSAEYAVEIQNATFRWAAPPKKDAAAAAAAGDDKTAKKASGRKAKKDAPPAVVVDDAAAAARPATLKSVSIKIRRGAFTAIVGEVGSGKSSLLYALLGEIPKESGSVRVAGRMAYMAQQPWIQNATVKNNIVFGDELDEERYKKAVEVCCLTRDLESLPNGDATEIGERGINLSGGQKARIQMARAVYNNVDIFLMDDPLSAVDAHVGASLFEDCICHTLHGRTRILVTHQLQYLSHCDQIIVMRDGAVVEDGSYPELMARGGQFANLIAKFVNSSKDNADDVAGGAAADDDPDTSASKAKVEPTSSAAATAASSSSSSAVTLVKPAAAAPPKPAGAKLIAEEERAVGGVALSVYARYIKSLGGWSTGVILLTLYVIDQGSNVLANWWLEFWSRESSSPATNRGVGFYLSLYAALVFLNAVLVFGRGFYMVRSQLYSARTLHKAMLDCVIRAPMSFFDTTPVGRILNRFSKDVMSVDMSLPGVLQMYLRTILSCLSTLLVIGIVTPLFLVAVLPLSKLYIFVRDYYLESSREIQRIDSSSRSPIYAQFQETLQGVSTIRSFGAGVVGRFIATNAAKVDTNQQAVAINTATNRWLGVRLEFLGTVVVSLASLFAALERNTISAGLAGLSITYALNLTGSLNWLVRMSSQTETELVAVERIGEYAELDTEAPAIIDDSRPPLRWPTRGKIEFRDLKLRYRPGLPLVLQGLNAVIQPGERIGVVGRTGAGKSSLMLALFRLVEADSGQILIDDVDIASIGLQDLRSNIAIIPQDPTLFEGTVRTNLDPFKEHGDDEIWEALESVSLKAFVGSLDGKLDGAISPGGENLSVGQRQLVCLARALLKKSRVLALDEATASIDRETEEAVQKALDIAAKNCTMLVIAHRLSTIRDSTRIAVIDDGRFVELASHKELMQKKGYYYELVKKSQQSERLVSV